MDTIKKVGIAIGLVALGLLGILLYRDHQEQKQISSHIAAQSNQVVELRQKKLKLENEDRQLQEEIAEAKSPFTCVILDFDHMNQNLYTEILPKMKEYGYKASFYLPNGQIPGSVEDGLTMEQFQALVAEGWDYYIGDSGASKYAASETQEALSEEWNNAFQTQLQLMQTSGIGLPTTYHVMEESLDTLVRDVLKGAGYLLVYASGNSLYCLNDEITYVNFPVNVVRLYSGDSQVINTLENAMNSGTDVIVRTRLVIDGYGEGENVDSVKFENFLAYIQGLEKNEEIRVMNFTEYYQHKLELNTKISKLQHSYDERKAEIDASIEEIDEEIASILKAGDDPS